MIVLKWWIMVLLFGGYVSVTPFRIENAQSNRSNLFISAHKVGMNENWCKTKPTRYCVDCKYYIPGSSIQHSKCKLFLNLNEDLSTLVSDDTSDKSKDGQGFHYCFTARYCPNMCGKNGKCYSLRSHKLP
jgi:hypothetical protein